MISLGWGDLEAKREARGRNLIDWRTMHGVRWISLVSMGNSYS